MYFSGKEEHFEYSFCYPSCLHLRLSPQGLLWGPSYISITHLFVEEPNPFSAKLQLKESILGGYFVLWNSMSCNMSHVTQLIYKEVKMTFFKKWQFVWTQLVRNGNNNNFFLYFVSSLYRLTKQKIWSVFGPQIEVIFYTVPPLF